MASRTTSLVLKVVLPGGRDVRRVRIDAPAALTADDLQRRVAALLLPAAAKDDLHAAHADSVSVAYDDDEDERVTIRTDQDFAEAVRVASDGGRKSLRLYVSGAEPAHHPTAPAASVAAKKKVVAVQTSKKKKTTTMATAAAASASASASASAATTNKAPKKKPTTLAAIAAAAAKPHDRGPPPKYEPRGGGSGDDGILARIKARKSAAQTATAKATAATTLIGKAPPPAPAAVTPDKPSKPVPLKTTSGGAKLFLDGSVEFGFGGEAELRPDGTVSCVLTRTGFPSVAAQGLSIVSGKYYYELTLQTAGCIQVGWADPAFVGRADRGEGVGDDAHSWAYDGYRQRRWHGTKAESWGPKWRVGQTVCCALDADLGVARFCLDGKWTCVPYHQTVAFTFGQGAAAETGGGAAGTAKTVAALGGLCPAVSFSNGQRCRFNFGAPGTPFRHSPPPGGYKGVWQAWGTADNAPPAEAAGRTRPTFTNSVRGSTASLSAAASSAPSGALPSAQERLVALVCRDEVRAALSKALSHPSVSTALQDVLVSLASGELKTGAQLKHACTTQLPQLMPALVGLVAKCPELLAVGTQLLATLAEMGVLPKAGGGRSRHYHRCGGVDRDRDRDRASRDSNWRQQPFCEGIRRWSGKLAEAVAHSAAAATEVAAAAVEQVSSAAASATGTTTTTPAAAAATTTTPTTTSSSTEALVQQAIQESAKAASERESDQIKQAVRLSLEEAEAAKALADAEAAADDSAAGERKESDTDGDSNPWAAVAAAPAAMPVLTKRATVVAVKRGSGNNNNNTAKSAAADGQRPRARFVKDNVPSGGQRAPLAPGQRFTHSWRLVNNGKEPWPDNVTARCVGGDPLLGASVDIRVPVSGPVQSKQAVDISVDLTAPEASGRYISYWRLHSGETRFGDRIWVDVVVLDKHSGEDEDQVAVPAAPAAAAAPVFADAAADAAPQRLPVTETSGADSDGSEDSDAVGADWVAVGNIALAMSQGGEQQDGDEKDEGAEDADADADADDETAETPKAEDMPPPAAEPAAEGEFKEEAGPAAEPPPAAAAPSTSPVDRLVSMGFDRDQVVGALALHGGKVEAAVAMLLGASM